MEINNPKLEAMEYRVLQEEKKCMFGVVGMMGSVWLGNMVGCLMIRKDKQKFQ